MTEIRVHAGSADEARAEGAAALDIPLARVRVEVLEADEDGVTARVWAVDVDEEAEPPAEPPAAAAAAEATTEVDEEAPAPLPRPVDSAAGDGEEADDAALAERARATLTQLLELMGVEATVTVAAETDEELILDVEGDDLGLVIGSFGQTLNAVQFLCNLMVNRRGRRRRIMVDAGGYRDRRREKLEEIAREHARRAKEERRGVILEGLRAAERRVIHTALQNDPDVVTFSEGEEPHRRLVISPRAK